MTLLKDLGERKIIEEILKPLYHKNDNFGDDCSVLDLGVNDYLVASTDPCPTPMASILGYNDFYYTGWLLATINLSDIAAMGAKPLTILTSYILPEDTNITDFKRLVQGVNECAKKCDCEISGGNIKESPFTSLSATAIGTVSKINILTRKGASPGEIIAVVGNIGTFWAGYFAHKEKVEISDKYKLELFKNILTPDPKIAEGLILSKSLLVSSCIDNSDGLYPSLMEIARQNDISIELNIDNIKYPESVLHISNRLDIDPFRFLMGWGDWQLFITFKKENYDSLVNALSACEYTITPIGEVIKGIPSITINYRGKAGDLFPLESERFSDKSWFTSGIEHYVNELLNNSIIL